MAAWLAPLKPTEFEVYWRSTYEETRAASKAKQYQENREEILARVRARRAAAKAAKQGIKK